MAVKDGSLEDDKLRLAFEDDDDDSSRTANRRVLFEQIGRTKCDPSSSSWDGSRATKGPTLEYRKEHSRLVVGMVGELLGS